MAKSLQDGYNEQIKIQKYSNEITDNLKLLDYLTIENSLTKQNNYAKNAKNAYEAIFKNLTYLKESGFFKNRPEAQETIEHIDNRLL
ncbi:MAG: hypothetical protein GXO30_06060, partial [Epsilonproteobacteria bacterium]|nr:hypothetical protein [Campylobacterota bacterium]